MAAGPGGGMPPALAARRKALRRLALPATLPGLWPPAPAIRPAWPEAGRVSVAITIQLGYNTGYTYLMSNGSRAIACLAAGTSGSQWISADLRLAIAMNRGPRHVGPYRTKLTLIQARLCLLPAWQQLQPWPPARVVMSFQQKRTSNKGNSKRFMLDREGGTFTAATLVLAGFLASSSSSSLRLILMVLAAFFAGAGEVFTSSLSWVTCIDGSH